MDITKLVGGTVSIRAKIIGGSVGAFVLFLTLVVLNSVVADNISKGRNPKISEEKQDQHFNIAHTWSESAAIVSAVGMAIAIIIGGITIASFVV